MILYFQYAHNYKKAHTQQPLSYNSKMPPLLLMLTLALVIQYSDQTKTQPYTYIGTSQSGTLLLYSNTTNSLSQGTLTFPITYSTVKTSNPKLVVSLHSLQNHDTMVDTALMLNKTAQTLVGFQVQLTTSGSCYLYLLYVSYWSIVDTSNVIWLIPQRIVNTTLSSGSGSRTAIISNDFYSASGGYMFANSSVVKVVTYLTAFQLQSATRKYKLSISLEMTNGISFLTTVKTDYDCKVVYARTMNVFINLTSLSQRGYYFYTSVIQFNSSVLQNVVPAHYGSFGHHLLGTISLQGSNILSASSIIVSYTISSMTNTTSTYLQLTTDTNALSQINYTYSYIAYIGCNSLYPYYTDSAYTLCTDVCGDYETQVPSIGHCLACVAPCLQCYGTTGNCTRCISGYVYTASNTCKQNQTTTTTTTSTFNRLYLLGLMGIFVLVGVCYVFGVEIPAGQGQVHCAASRSHHTTRNSLMICTIGNGELFLIFLLILFMHTHLVSIYFHLGSNPVHRQNRIKQQRSSLTN